MNKKLRYIILAICCAIFIGLAPSLVLFVRGVKYDSEGSKLHPTGIIAIDTDPNAAEVFLDGKNISSTPASIRFLKAGDYTVRVHKEGYLDWQKKLTVLEDKVTWGSPNPNKLTLLRLPVSPKLLATDVRLEELMTDNTLLYTNGKNIVLLSGDGFGSTQTILAPEAIQAMLTAPSKDRALLYGNTHSYLFTASKKILAEVTNLVPNGSKFLFTTNSEGLLLTASTLYRVNFETKIKTTLLENIQNFYVVVDQVYVAQNTDGVTTLLSSKLTDTEKAQPLLAPFPSFKTIDILVTAQKQVFVVGDGRLFRVGGVLEELAANIRGFTFDFAANSLSFTTPGELNYYNFDENKVKLISRSSLAFTGVLLRRDLNYAFYFHGTDLIAIELDDRDRQNTYTLLRAAKPQRITFTQDGKSIILLDNDTLSLLTIR